MTYKRIKISFIISLLLVLTANLFSLSDSYSLSFADSYFSRAKASQALNWNPANIGEESYLDLPFLNTNISLTNNLFDLDMNGISGKYLTDKDKEDILAEIDGSFVVDGSFRTLIFGVSDNNLAFSIGLNVLSSSKISEEFIRISLYGNETDNYHFNNSDLAYNLLSYTDISAGMGGLKLDKIIPSLANSDLPEIEYGISASLLTGIANVKSSSFTADYLADIDSGLQTQAYLKQKEAFGGFGLKFNLSFNSQVNENLSLGMGFDNLLGFITWTGKTRIREKRYWIEDVYISDLEEDILSDEDGVSDIDKYTTSLPVIYRFGSLYDFGKVDLSIDYSHTFNDNNYNLGRNSISLATELKWIAKFPFQIGIKLGDGDNVVSTAYGVTYKGNYFQTGIGLQVADTILPGKSSKALSFGIHTQLSLN
jgi:hypothetical protein